MVNSIIPIPIVCFTSPYMVNGELSFLIPLFVSHLPPTFPYMVICNLSFLLPLFVSLSLPLFRIWPTVNYKANGEPSFFSHCLSHSLPLFLIWSSVFFHSFSPPLFLIWSTVNPYHHCHVYLSPPLCSLLVHPPFSSMVTPRK